MVAQKSTIFGLLASVAVAIPSNAQASGCSVITYASSGAPVWHPTADPTWSAWSSSTTTTTKATTKDAVTSSTWSAWSTTTTKVTTKDPVTSSSTTWDPWTSSSTKDAVTSTTSAWADWGVTSSTTTKPATTTTKAATTTTTTQAAQPTNCGCAWNEFDGYKVDASNTPFFGGQYADTRAECEAQCNENEACTAILYIDADSYKNNAQDYKICYQTHGLPQPGDKGDPFLAYKKDCTTTCPKNYNTFGAN